MPTKKTVKSLSEKLSSRAKSTKSRANSTLKKASAVAGTTVSTAKSTTKKVVDKVTDVDIVPDDVLVGSFFERNRNSFSFLFLLFALGVIGFLAYNTFLKNVNDVDQLIGNKKRSGYNTPKVNTQPKNSNNSASQQKLDSEGKPLLSKDGGIYVQNEYFHGDEKAEVVILEYSNYDCTFCAKFNNNTLPQIEKEYIETGKVKYMFKNYPIVSGNKSAMASEYSKCLQEEKGVEALTPFSKGVFAKNLKYNKDDLRKIAIDSGATSKRLDTCMESGRYADLVKKDIENVKGIYVKSTPTFFIGSIDEEGYFRGSKFVGERKYEFFKEKIEGLL